MSNTWFQFKQFMVHHDRCAMKVTTDASLFGAWVADQLRRNRDDIQSILDIGAGTGLLSLMVAQKLPGIPITAIELDKESAKQAGENVTASNWNDNITVIEGDARLYHFNNSFDCIISNPPFYENELRSPEGSRNLAHHSDELKLSEVIDIIKSNLSPDGCFFLLLPYKRDTEIRKLLMSQRFHIDEICLVRQTPAHDFFRVMLKVISGARAEKAAILNEIIITDEQQKYTPEFTRLLKDYYLKL